MATAVAKKKKTEVAEVTDLDALFEQDAGSGNENLTSEDMAIPFLKILAKIDPILDENEDLRAGDLYNTATGQSYSAKSGGVKVIPCAYERIWIEWEKRGQGSNAPVNIYKSGDVLPKVARDPTDNKDYVEGKVGVYLEETHQHFVVIINPDGTTTNALIAMKSTQLKKSRRWNTMLNERKRKKADGTVYVPPRYGSVFTLNSEAESNDKGNWHGWDIQFDEWVSDPVLYQEARAFYKSVTKGEVIVKHESDDDDAGASPASGTGEQPF